MSTVAEFKPIVKNASAKVLWEQVVDDKVKSVYFAQAGDTLVVVGEKNRYAWKASHGNPVDNQGLSPDIPARPAFPERTTFSPDLSKKAVLNVLRGTQLVIDGRTGHATSESQNITAIIDRTTGKTLFYLKNIDFKSLEFSPDGQRVAYVADTTGPRYGDLPSFTLTVANAFNGKTLGRITTHEDFHPRKLDGEQIPWDAKRFLTFSPDSSKLAVAERDGTVRVLAVNLEKEI